MGYYTMAVFERRKSNLFIMSMPNWLDGIRSTSKDECYRDGSERVCWKLTFIQFIPARPLLLESVELTRLASTAVRAVRKHITSQTNYLQHRLIIHLEHLLNC